MENNPLNEPQILAEQKNTSTFQKGKNMIAVASGKRSVGKTWFSITLAHALSSLKQKTLFFDADLGLSNIDNQLGLSIEDDLGSVVSGHKTLNQIITSNDKTKFDIIAGRSGSAGLSTLPIGRLQILSEDLHLVSSSYQKVIMDMSSGTEKPVCILSGMAEKIIVICNDTPSTLTEAYSYIRTMVSQYQKQDIQIVINQANSPREGERTFNTISKACQEFLKISPSLLGIVRNDTRIRDSIRNQVSILNRYPTSEASEDVINIARKLLS